MKDKLVDLLSKDNRILKEFFRCEVNKSLLHKYQKTSNEEVKIQLDTRFRAFYFKVKAISYLSKLIYYEAIHYDQRTRQNDERFSLILDKHVEGTDLKLINLIASKDREVLPMNQLEDYITDENIYHAVRLLTDKQKEILYLIFVKEKKEKEVSLLLGISQQAVSKQKKAALRKIKEVL